MYIDNSKAYWLNESGIHNIEKLKNAQYMGYWAIKNSTGSWSASPVDVFYVENPDTSKGHSHYFGMFYREAELYITNASSAFIEPITGILCEDGEVIVSRYRHDFVTKGDIMIDGGRDYVKSSIHRPFINVTVDGGEFKFEPVISL